MNSRLARFFVKKPVIFVLAALLIAIPVLWFSTNPLVEISAMGFGAYSLFLFLVWPTEGTTSNHDRFPLVQRSRGFGTPTFLSRFLKSSRHPASTSGNNSIFGK